MRCNMEKQKKKLSKVKRIILWVLVVLIAVLAIALISFMAFLDGIVATAIRQVGPALTGTEVKVSDVTISLMDGRARISGFVVGNPEGYSTPEAMKFDEFFVDINLTSMLGGEELIINEIYIKSPRISLETSIYGGSNLGDIQEHLEQVTAAEESGEVEAQPQETPEQAEAGKKVVISKLVIEDATVVLANKELGTDIPLTLPTLTLTDIGRDNAVSIAEAIDYIYSELILGITQAIKDANLGKELENMAGQITTDVSGAASSAGDELKKAGEQLGKDLENAGKSIGDGLKSFGESIGL